MYKYLIFDVFKTIIDTGTGSFDSFVEMKEKNKWHIDPNIVYKRFKEWNAHYYNTQPRFMPEKELFPASLRKVYTEMNIKGKADEDIQIYMNKIHERRKYKDTDSTLESLKSKFRIAIASNSDEEPLNTVLKNNSLSFENVFTSESLGAYKPRREFYEKVLMLLRVQPSEVIFIGDSMYADVFGPSQLNIDTCWVNRKNKTLSLGIQRPKYEIHTLGELLKILI